MVQVRYSSSSKPIRLDDFLLRFQGVQDQAGRVMLRLKERRNGGRLSANLEEDSMR